MKQYKYIITLAFVVITVLYFNQCSNTRDVLQTLADRTRTLNAVSAKYLTLLEAKQKTDTVYKEGKTQYVENTVFKTIRDTIKVIGTDTLNLYESALERPDLRLKAKIWAANLHDISYEYNVTEKIVIQNNIVEVHDTLMVKKYRNQLLGVGEVGKDYFGVGLQFQTNKRIGILAKSNWYDRKQYYTIGLSYRIF